MLSLLLPLLVSPTASATDVAVSLGDGQGSARMVGMAGAYRAIAEGAQAVEINPAAVAVRGSAGRSEGWEWDGIATGSGILPALRALELSELDDAPLPTVGLTGGLLVRRDAHAGTLLVDWRSLYDEESARGTILLNVSGGWGLSLADDRLQVGILPGILLARTRPVDGGLTAVLPTLGAGVRWDVPRSPVRLGLSGRTPWRTRVDDTGVDGVRVPWNLGMGVAVRRGEMSHGPRPDDRDARRAELRDRLFVQAAFDVVLEGPLDDVVSVEAWTRDTFEASETPATIAFALGVETEPLRRFLRVRMGLYTDPARAQPSLDGMVLHGTFGLDLGLFDFPKGRTRWMIGPAVDASRLGVRPALGLGTW